METASVPAQGPLEAPACADATLALSGGDRGRSVRAQVGDVIAISLVEISTAGYSWFGLVAIHLFSAADLPRIGVSLKSFPLGSSFDQHGSLVRLLFL